MEIKTIKYELKGIAPLLMHNGELADPENPFTKELKIINARRKKVDEDFQEISKLEFLGGLYTRKGKIVIPSELIEACLIEGAKKSKLGKLFKATVYLEGDYPLIYKGPKSPEALWKDKNFVHKAGARIGMSKIIRTRPIFKEWSLLIDVNYYSSEVEVEAITTALEYGGKFSGIGDWRPKYGRFIIKEVK